MSVEKKSADCEVAFDESDHPAIGTLASIDIIWELDNPAPVIFANAAFEVPCTPKVKYETEGSIKVAYLKNEEAKTLSMASPAS